MIYQRGLEYQLLFDYNGHTEIRGYAAEFEGIDLRKSGVLRVQAGFQWDGPSGPPRWLRNIPLVGWLYSPLIKSLLEASLVHDVLYTLLNQGLLPKPLRNEADWEFYRIARESGTCWFRARLALWAIRRFGRFAITRKVEEA